VQGLILAAGIGRRLGELTRDRPKAMLEVAGRTLIERALDALAELGVSRIVLVVGYRAEQLMMLIGDSHRGVPVIYVTNPEYSTTNNIYSLFRARQEFASDDSLLLEADVIFDHSILEQLATDPRTNVVAVARYHPGLDGTVVTLSESGHIDAFIPKQLQDHDRSDYFKTINIYKFSKSYIESTYMPFLDAYVAALGKNAYYEEVLSILTGLALPKLSALVVTDHRWYEIDNAEDLLNASTVFAAPEDVYSAYASRYGGLWRFPHVRDFALLVNPYFPPPSLKRELERSFSTVMSMYPSTQEVLQHLAAHLFEVAHEEIVVGNGASELIAALGAAAGGQTIGVPVPAFEEYRCRFQPGQVVDLCSASTAPNLSVEELVAALGRVDVLVVVNPHNPSGACLTTDELETLSAEAARLGKRIILDESFVDFADPDYCTSWIESNRLRDNPHVVVLKSLGKTYGLPGLRLGVMATADKDLLAQVRSALPVWNISSPAESLMELLPRYREDYKRSMTTLRVERERFISNLNDIDGIECFPSQANFVLCKLVSEHSAHALADRLLTSAGLLIKPMSDKAGLEHGEHVRIAVLDGYANDLLVKHLAASLESVVSDDAKSR
jgi:histidinol-phosphate/aromatic aminotransferase/cobyric acid decarboxylase-like protein/choline kinase